MKRKVWKGFTLAILFIPLIAFAKDGDVVTVAINKWQTYTTSSVIYNAQNYMEYDVYNNNGSERDLFGNCYVFFGLGDFREINSERAAPGRSKNRRWHTGNDPGQPHYYLELDPVGIGTKGCIGNGTLYD